MDARLIDGVVALGSAGVIVAIFHDAFEVMLLPRRVKSKTRIVYYFFRGRWALWSAAGRRFRSVDRGHNFLGLYGPLSLVVLLIVWAIGLISAFGSIYWALFPAQFRSHPWLSHVYFSGVTFFTLGYGDLVPHGAVSRVLSVVEAGTGLGFIAMVIGYLPVMYQLFSRREAQVILLDSVAGSPPTCTTILCRYAEGHSLDALDRLLLEWQHWAAELLESQLSYPMLAYYRSQHENQSWLAALTAIMDLSVLVMVGFDGVRTLQARLTFTTARLAVIEMGRALGAGPHLPAEARLSSEGFAGVKTRLAAAGLHFADENEAEEKLAAFRDTYEPFVTGLAGHLLLSLPRWFADFDQLDNWANSPRGKSAKLLLASVQAEPESGPATGKREQG
ncbi:MAG TPA: potassium channel family protein [Bryobacteraceae bacterium]|nr:potassium channel family protein [Bryobacteraceae bacterium]